MIESFDMWIQGDREAPVALAKETGVIAFATPGSSFVCWKIRWCEWEWSDHVRLTASYISSEAGNAAVAAASDVTHGRVLRQQTSFVQV